MFPSQLSSQAYPPSLGTLLFKHLPQCRYLIICQHHIKPISSDYYRIRIWRSEIHIRQNQSELCLWCWYSLLKCSGLYVLVCPLLSGVSPAFGHLAVPKVLVAGLYEADSTLLVERLKRALCPSFSFSSCFLSSLLILIPFPSPSSIVRVVWIAMYCATGPGVKSIHEAWIWWVDEARSLKSSDAQSRLNKTNYAASISFASTGRSWTGIALKKTKSEIATMSKQIVSLLMPGQLGLKRNALLSLLSATLLH